MSRPSASRTTVDPSSIRWRNEGESGHAQGRPARQARQTPHGMSQARATGCPTCRSVTPGPTASMTPAPSWPMTTGTGRGQSPSRTCRSEWQTPDARIRTRTSPARGAASVSGSMRAASPPSRRTAPRIAIGPGAAIRSRSRAGARRPWRACTGRSRATTSPRRPRPRSPRRRAADHRRRRSPRDRPGRPRSRPPWRSCATRPAAHRRAGTAPRSPAASARDRIGQGPGGEQEHPLGDGPGLGHDGAEAHAREDERRCWPGRPRARRPSRTTASNGEPVATIARPSVQSRMSAGTASDGRGGVRERQDDGPLAVPSAIARRAASVNVPATPVVPTSTVGRSRRIVPTRSVGPAAGSGRGHRQLALHLVEVVAAVVDEPARVDRRDRALHVVARSGRRRASPGGAAGRCRSRRRRPRPARSVRRARAVPVARRPASTPATTTAAVPWMSSLKDGTRAAYRSSRRSALTCLKSSNWMTQPGQTASTPTTNASTSASYSAPRSRGARWPRYSGSAEQGRVVRADVERDRQRQGRVDAARRGIERELADRDGHAARALVAEAEDPLVVRDHDEPDVLDMGPGGAAPGSGRGPRA